ncbi:MAG TPA: ClpX C4-type zinc finger protein [Chloroflexota bacterium]|nr:ClpX C4-type zinc finger protein [Chloroflexota bacterium]
MSRGSQVSSGQAGGDKQCSFCSRPRSDVGKLIAGPHAVFICDQCVRMCAEIISAAENAVPSRGI